MRPLLVNRFDRLARVPATRVECGPTARSHAVVPTTRVSRRHHKEPSNKSMLMAVNRVECDPTAQ